MTVTYPGNKHNEYAEFEYRLNSALNEAEHIALSHNAPRTTPQKIRLSGPGEYLTFAMRYGKLYAAVYNEKQDCLSKQCDYSDIHNITKRSIESIIVRMENMANAMEKGNPVVQETHITALWSVMMENPDLITITGDMLNDNGKDRMPQPEPEPEPELETA